MATDNAAIHIDTDDERGNDEIYQSTIEGEKPSRPPSIRDSMQRLISIDVRSVPSSVHSSLKSQKLLCIQFVDLIKSFFLNTKLFWITVTFTFFGGYIFMYLEIPADLAAKERELEHHLIARDVLLWSIEMVHNSSSLQKRNEWKDAIMHFEIQIGRRLPLVKTDWTFWQAVLYAGTISTTIGYGNIGCRTIAGRTASMIYAMFGIPLLIVVLDSLGASLLILLKKLSYVIDDFCFFIAVRLRLRKLKNEKERSEFKVIARRYAKLGIFTYRVPARPPIAQSPLTNNLDKLNVIEEANLITDRPASIRQSSVPSRIEVVDEIGETIDDQATQPLTSDLDAINEEQQAHPDNKRSSKSGSITSSTKAVIDETEESIELEEEQQKEATQDLEEQVEVRKYVEEEDRDPPVAAALISTIGCIALSAYVFCFWEDWDYFTSFYFFFISLSTIGFGDVIPAYPEYVVAAFSLVLIGLALVTVCINVVQEKISLMYIRLLSKMLEKYMKAQEEGDPEALKDFVSGFNSQAKFLMPLVSKNESAKVMKRFKAQAKARGIELPSALTDVDPKTGKPAFSGLGSENIDSFVEQKKQEAQAVIHSPTFQHNSCATQTFLSHGHKHRRLQTEVPDWCLESYSFGAQCGAEYQDAGAQTDTESVDSGVQCECEIETTATQFDPAMISQETGTFTDIEYTTTGIQPEVSFIMQLMEEDADLSSSESESGHYVGEGSDDEEQPRVRLQRDQMPKKSTSEKRDRHGELDLRYMHHQDTQTEINIESTGIQFGPSTFIDFRDAEVSSFQRRDNAEVQVGPQLKHHGTQKKLKVKSIEIQNKIMNTLQVETETQVELEDQESETQTELVTSDQSVQATEDLKVAEAQTDVVEFLELKAVVEMETQANPKTQNRKAQTKLSSTMRDPETYKQQKEELMQSAKKHFEREREKRKQAAKRRTSDIPLDDKEIQHLKALLFQMRKDKARELKMENEMITFNTEEEIEKLLEILKILRMSDGTSKPEELVRLLRESDFPIEQIEKDFDFELLLKLLHDESEKDDLDDEDQELLMFTQSQETQTEILVFHRKDVEVSAIVEIADVEPQTEISAFSRSEIALMTEPLNSTAETQTETLVDHKEMMTANERETVHVQTSSFFFKMAAEATQTSSNTTEQPTQTTAIFVEIGCDPIVEVIQANMPSVWSTDTQTPLPNLTNSASQSDEIKRTDSGIQAIVEMRNVQIDSTVDTKESSTEYTPSICTVECQTYPSTSEIGIGIHIEVADAEVQYKIDVREIGIQPNVSAFRIDQKEELPEDVFFMADTAVQYEDPRTFADVGTFPNVSMFASPSNKYETEEECVLRMVDIEVQATKEHVDVGTAPKVSMFKPRSLDESGQPVVNEEATIEGGDFYLNDFGVQHDREMEDRKNVGIQPRVSMIKSAIAEKKTVEDYSDVHFMVDAEVGKPLDMIDAEIQPSCSMFYKKKGKSTTVDLTTNFMSDAGTQDDTQYRNSDTQTNVSSVNAECQAEPMTNHMMQQTLVASTVNSSQTNYISQQDEETQTQRIARTSVTQTSVMTADATAGPAPETTETGIQPTVSMFRLEDVRSKQVGATLPTNIYFMSDCTTATNPRYGRISTESQYEANTVNAEVQTHYTGSLQDQYNTYRLSVTRNKASQTGVLSRLQPQYKEPVKLTRRASGPSSSRASLSPKE